ncbi:LysR family transcriptional regulator [Pseudonocardia nigra]|uniref:LysR family transcriptional regulator n=1 Tax=Pseudonocardia nigra TaxID=1921578 RepID=UPI001C5CD2A5|nr:LysR family transcriptional regulator [Pseudonocardia nigra]
MDLHQVEYFLAVVDHKGITAAATALDLAQPTVSQAVRALERELGVPLFHRIGRGMVLTSAGHSLVGPARRILRDVVAAEGSLLDDAGRPRGRLDIVAMPALAADPVARLVGAFRRRFPAVVVRIGDLRDESATPTLIRDGHCEIVVRHLPMADGGVVDGGGLAVRELGEHEYWLVLPPGSQPPAADPLPLSQLPEIPHVIVPRGSSQAVDEIEQAVSAAGRSITPSVVLEHREARLPFVLAGVGASLLERSVAEAAVARGAVVRAVEPRISRAYGLVYDPGALSPAGREFVALAGAG